MWEFLKFSMGAVYRQFNFFNPSTPPPAISLKETPFLTALLFRLTLLTYYHPTVALTLSVWANTEPLPICKLSLRNKQCQSTQQK